MKFAFNNWHAFWQMGGYSAFVWTAYAIALGALVLMAMQSIVRFQNAKNKKSG